MNMRFTFALTARYPTEKAYGVTTTGCVRALRNLGHSVEVISAYNLNRQKRFLEADKKYARQITMPDSIAKWTFKLNQIKFGVTLALRNKKSNLGILWTREVVLAVLLTLINPESTIVIEIHQIPNRVERRALAFISKKTNVIICPIKDYLAQQTDLKKDSYLTLPMAVPNSFIEYGSRTNWPKRVDGKISVIYLGRAFNAHEKLDLQYLCKNFESLIQASEKIEITYIGIDKYLVEPYLKKSSLNSVKIIPNLPHHKVLEELSNSDIGILAYPNSHYYRSIFPIKLVEYAASKTLIVASDTPGHREILGQDLALYYSLDDEFALKHAILNVIQCPSNYLQYVKSAFEWSKSYTYENRVLRVINEIMKRKL